MSAKDFLSNPSPSDGSYAGQHRDGGAGGAPPAAAGGSRFDRLLRNETVEDDDEPHDAAAACPYGAMSGGGVAVGGGGGGGIAEHDTSGGGIELDGGDESDEDGVSIMAPEEAVQVRISGWLKKFAVGRSGFFKNWKRRFFICDSGILEYFENDAPKATALSTINLAGGQGLRLVTCPTKKTHPEVVDPDLDLVLIFTEEGGSSERKLLLRADTSEEHTQWCVVMGAFTPLVDHEMDFPANM